MHMHRSGRKEKKKLKETKLEMSGMQYLDAMLETIKLPAGIADLDPSLADVDRDTLSHLLQRRN